MNRIWIAAGAVLACAAVAAGALGRHALEAAADDWFGAEAARRLAQWDTAARYLIYHALACLILGGTEASGLARRVRNAAGALFLAGAVLFSGCLAAFVLSGWKPLIAVVPVGGVCFLAGWLTWAASTLVAADPKK